MKLQTDGLLKQSDKGYFYAFYHPITLRKYFSWFPKSLTKVFPNGEIKIPDWLWIKKKQELNL